MEDPRIKTLRALIREVIQLQQATDALLTQLTDQLHAHTDTADDRPERRKKPRT